MVGSWEQLEFAVQTVAGKPLQTVDHILGIADHARGDRLVHELQFERFERAFDLGLVPPDQRTGGHTPGTPATW